MATKRDGVFVWITWLSRVMAGEQNCEWASWFKAHYEKYDKAPSDFDTAKWNIEHTLQLRRLRIASLEPYLLLGCATESDGCWIFAADTHRKAPFIAPCG